MSSYVFVCFLLSYVKAVSIGSIRDISFNLSSSSSSTTINGSRQICLCTMMSSSTIAALNYFPNNTCQLFPNASLINVFYSWTTNTNGFFYFLQLSIATAVVTTQKPTTSVAAKTSITTVSSTKTVLQTTTATNIAPVTVAGNGVAGSSMQQLNSPNDVAVTSNGTLYVADYLNNRIQVFGPSNTTAISSQTGLSSPLTVCLDNSSNYYTMESISDTNRLAKWPSNQTLFIVFNGYGIAIDSGGNLFISTLSNTILYWNKTANTNITLVSGLNGPRHTSLDEGHQALYIADAGNNRVVKYSIGVGNLTVVAGGHGSGSAANQLNYPCGVAVSKTNSAVYVADTYNNRVQKWVVNGTAGVTILGNTNGTYGNGIYELNLPYAVALDPAATYLYVADSNNNRIQRVSVG